MICRVHKTLFPFPALCLAWFVTSWYLIKMIFGSTFVCNYYEKVSYNFVWKLVHLNFLVTNCYFFSENKETVESVLTCSLQLLEFLHKVLFSIWSMNSSSEQAEAELAKLSQNGGWGWNWRILISGKIPLFYDMRSSHQHDQFCFSKFICIWSFWYFPGWVGGWWVVGLKKNQE